MKHTVIVESPKDWPINIPGVDVLTAKEYLTLDEKKYERRQRVYNLCRSYKYQSSGYYVSLLAAARRHKPLPTVSTIQDLKSPALVRLASSDLDELIQKSLEDLKSNEFTLSIYFGKNLAKRHNQLSAKLFSLFPAPFLRAYFRFDEKWELRSIKSISGNEIPESHHSFVEEAAREHFKNRKRAKKEEGHNFDLAILVNPQEKHPPSNPKSIQKFIKAAAELGIAAECIGRDDYGRLAEFDALFIRETTSVNHHTYRFARRAKAEGLVVIDDPDSILTCTNKIYLAELLEAHKIRTPKTMIVHRDNIARVEENIGFPCILKQPDSAFSQGVKKASNNTELNELLNYFFTKSDLVLAQEYLPSEFDWRIGILDKQPLYACKYFMARSHWQITKHSGSGKHQDGRVETLNITDVPEKVLSTALKAAGLIGDGLYGVDLKEINGKCYVIEINDNPSIDHGYEDAILKNNLYHQIMLFFRNRIEKKKQRVLT